MSNSGESIQIVTDAVSFIWLLNRYHVARVAIPDVADTQIDRLLQAELSVK